MRRFLICLVIGFAACGCASPRLMTVGHRSLARVSSFENPVERDYHGLVLAFDGVNRIRLHPDQRLTWTYEAASDLVNDDGTLDGVFFEVTGSWRFVAKDHIVAQMDEADEKGRSLLHIYPVRVGGEFALLLKWKDRFSGSDLSLQNDFVGVYYPRKEPNQSAQTTRRGCAPTRV